MQELEKMQSPDYRYQVFASVFNTEAGQLVLRYLDAMYRIQTPNYEQPNEVYWRLGRQSVINHINTILTQGKKE